MNEPDDLSESGSGIHVTRNNFVIQGLERGMHIKDVVGGTMPSALARDFMHEITHHWCFTLLVGYAMAALRHRARLALMVGPEDDANINQAFTDEVLLCCTRAALDPLAEGLALFAEFDVYPEPLASIPVLNWLASMFLLPELEQLHSVGEGEKLRFAKTMDISIGQLLDASRKASASRRVRENLLSQPLALKGRGHYLLGYMLVKRVARRLRQAVGPLAESGLVLEWIARFLFEDSRLVLMLLGTERVERADEILARIEARVDALFCDKAIDWFSAFAKDRIERTPIVAVEDNLKLITSTAPTLGLEPQEAQAAVEMAYEASEQFYASPGVGDLDRLAVGWAMTMRHMSLLGRIDGSTRVNPIGSVNFFHPHIQFLAGGVDGIEPGVGSGSFMLFFSAWFGRCLCVSRGDEMVVISPMAKSPSAPPSEELTFFVIQPLEAYPICDARLRQLQQWYRNTLQTISPGWEKAIREQIRADLEGVYLRAALGEAPLSRYPDLIKSMSEAGFFSLVDFDLERLRDLVTLGLPGAEQVSSTRVADLRAQGKVVGLPLVEQIEGRSTACF